VNDGLILLLTFLTFFGPLALAAMGGILSERAGIMNIALEGKMLMACVAVAIGSQMTGHGWAGLLAGLAATVLLSLAHLLLTQVYRIDHIISGMALNAIALGGSRFLDDRLLDAGAGQLPSVPVWLFGLIAVVLPLALALWLARSRAGLRLLATGNDPDKSRQMGVDVRVVRVWALAGTGVCCGLAGAMIVWNAGSFTDDMTAGRGFIALAALIVGGWRPIPTAVVCMAFAALLGLNLWFQGTPVFGVELPSEMWQAMPYLVTLLAIAFIPRRTGAPAGLGKP
jgi:simple sugar transport system permease protein